MRPSQLRGVVAVVALAVLLALPIGWAGQAPLGSYARAAPPTSPGHSLLSAPAVRTTSGGTSGVPHPSVTCPYPPYPIWTAVGTTPAYPIVPDQIPQVSCGKISIDEVHASLGSSTTGSGERWTIPVHVPIDSSTNYQADSYPQFYVGMVVSGDAHSQWRQSYAAVTFQPQGAPVSSYLASVHVFALDNASWESGVCAGDEMNITWNNSFFCVLDDVKSGTVPTSSIPAGDWLNLTFAGATTQSTGLDIWVNDSTNSADSLSTVLDSTNTAVANFEPFYTAACADTCMLKWSVNAGTGLGFGFTMCPFSSVYDFCNAYNDTRFNGTHPVEFGIPHFWTGSSYSGDYRYFAPQSTSGVCNGIAPPGTLATCFSQDTFGGDGYYPSFSYNGSLLDYGVSRSWTTQDWGGSAFELLSTGAPNDLTPFYFLKIANDSHAGFLAPGSAVNVTAHLQDLGSVTYAGLTYRVNGGPATSLQMTRQSGSANDGIWTVEIPSGPNGWVNYSVNATNGAGAQILSPSAGQTYHLQRGPLPTFTVQVLSSLASCGGIEINGGLYPSGSAATFSPGTYPILGIGCYPYVFNGWTLSPGITVEPTGALSGNVTISAAGTIQASWKYVTPLDTVELLTTPPLCGQIILDGVGYFPPSTGQSVQVLDGTNISLGETGCGGYSFSGWGVGGNFTILGGNFVAHGNGTLTATYVSSTGSYTIIFATNPAGCGGILFRGAGYTSGQTLAEAAGTYAIAPDPCYHWGFLSWGVSGSSLSASNGTLTVSGSGTLTETNYVLTIVTFVTSPANCGTITFDGLDYTNGESVVVANNSTHSVFASSCPGHYLFSITGTNEGLTGVTVTGNLATVTGSGDVIATSLSGSPNNFVGFLTDPPTCGAILYSGVRYTSSNFTYVATGSQATVVGQPCSAYGFVEWITFGGITIVNSTAFINGPGAIEAVFRPLASVFLYTSPAGCGTINIGGVPYASNSTVQLTEDRAYALSATPCLGYALSSWVNSSGALIVGGNLTLTAGSVLTAVFLPVRYAVTVLVNPPRCGGIRISGQDDGNGTVLSLAHGTYSVVPVPCTGDHLVSWSLTANLAVTNTTLWVNGSGTITAVYQPVPPSVTLSVSSSSFAGIAVPFSAEVAVPVPPYNYNYTWNFGDGAPLTTPVNFTSHTYSQPGRYTVTLSVTDPYNRTANASSTIQIVPASAGQVTGLTTLSIAAIGLAVVAVVAVVVIGSRLRRPPPEPSPSLQFGPEPTFPSADESPMEAPKP